MSDTQQFSARKANKNAILLMLRSAIGIVVGLYTSRIIYNSLGIDDYGLNAVIGGMLPLFTFISATLSGATSRFITFEIGRGEVQRTRETFTAAFYTHIILAFLVALVCEIGGIYLLYHQLNIPPGRETAAFIVLQCAIVGIIVNITQVPYTAVLIAYERFTAYAYISLLGTFLGLCSALTVQALHTDKLILYVCLNMGINLLVIFITRIYCLRHHEESHLLRRVNWKLIRPILSYSTWDLFAQLCGKVYEQSQNYLVNIFFGVRYNTSISTSTTVTGAVSSLTTPLRNAFIPQITKQYAQGSYDELSRVIGYSLRLSYIAIGLISIPTFFNAEAIFICWLGSIPPIAHLALRCGLVAGFIFNFQASFSPLILATGRIRNYSIINGFVALFLFGLIYLVFRWTRSFEYGLIVTIIGQLLYTSITLCITQSLVSEIKVLHIVKKAVPILLCTLPSCIATYAVCLYMDDNFIQIVVSTIIADALFSSLAYFFVLNQQERDFVLQFIKKKVTSLRSSLFSPNRS